MRSEIGRYADEDFQIDFVDFGLHSFLDSSVGPHTVLRGVATSVLPGVVWRALLSVGGWSSPEP